MAEEIKNLRTAISFSGENIKTVVITSCAANEGKSTISLEIVRSFAELGKKWIAEVLGDPSVSVLPLESDLIYLN